MGPAHIREYCELDDTSKALMRSAMNQLGMSARAFHRVLKLARTIADLAGAEEIQAAHLAEAIHLRSAEETRLKANHAWLKYIARKLRSHRGRSDVRAARLDRSRFK